MTANKLEQTPNAFDALGIVVSQQGTTTTIVIQGEWDLAAQPAAQNAIRAALARDPECVVLDLSQLTFIDSTGLHDVIDMHNGCAQQNVRLVIIPGPRAVQRPFEICQLTDRLPFLTPARHST